MYAITPNLFVFGRNLLYNDLGCIVSALPAVGLSRKNKSFSFYNNYAIFAELAE
jgi:hypothetical protein